jgi:alpha-D-ribose 1-methylphosphonate 5-triphosphate synthase subunit PhnG
MLTISNDHILVECDEKSLVALVTGLEHRFPPTIIRKPEICLTMIQAEDSVEKQPFYLGESLTTECEVMVCDQSGIGICLGDEPQRAYCIAYVDALLQSNNAHDPELVAFLQEQGKHILKNQQEEFDLIMKTRVDFKLMEQQ